VYQLTLQARLLIETAVRVICGTGWRLENGFFAPKSDVIASAKKDPEDPWLITSGQNAGLANLTFQHFA
jgi:hypothetical protein